MDKHYLTQMLFWYLVTIAIETAILVVGLSRRHPVKHRLFAGAWLTACTYPILWLVLPALIDPQKNNDLYLAVGETFVPVAECLLFWLAFGRAEPRTRSALTRDMAVIVIANLASFLGGLWIQDWLVNLKQQGRLPWEWLGGMV
jgi:hypothetical protein